MAITKGTLTVAGTTGTKSTGRTISLRGPARGGRYTAQVVFNAFSTTAKITMQGSLDGTVWKTIGTTGTLVKSSAPFVNVSTTPAFSLIRALLTSRTTKAGGTPKVAIFMNGG